MENQNERPSKQAQDEAKNNPGGWVYKIDGNYSTDQHIPNWAIIGAWQVDNFGVIESDLIPNPSYNFPKCRERDLDQPK